ncbi:Nucleoporin POM34, partial [Neolecta irregularis DAH-3]
SPETPNNRLDSLTSHQDLPVGVWRHPALDTVLRTARRRGLDQDIVRRLLWNFTVLFVFSRVKNLLSESDIPVLFRPLSHYTVYWNLIEIAFQGLCLFNIMFAAWRLCSPRDNFAELALTPSQRTLLGLDPTVASSIFPSSFQRRYHSSEIYQIESTESSITQLNPFAENTAHDR